MTITEARIALDKLGWHQLTVVKWKGSWLARIHRQRRNGWYLVVARKRHDAIERIVLWAQVEAKKAQRVSRTDNAAEAAGGKP